jgi:hypothetical protein
MKITKVSYQMTDPNGKVRNFSKFSTFIKHAEKVYPKDQIYLTKKR